MVSSAKYEVFIPYGALSADSYSEFLAIVRREKSFWENLIFPNNIVLSADNRARNITQQMWTRVQYVFTYWVNIEAELEGIDGRSFGDVFPRLKADIEGSDETPFYSQSSLAKKIKIYLEYFEYKDAASLIIGFALDRKKSFFPSLDQANSVAAWLGYVQALYSASKQRDDGIGCKSDDLLSVEGVAEDISKSLGVLYSKHQEMIDGLEAKANDKIASGDRAFSEILASARSTANEVIDIAATAEAERVKKFDDILVAFNAHLRLKRPVELWQERQVEHQDASVAAWKRFKVGAVLLVLCAVISATFLGDVIADAFIKSGCELGTEPQCSGVSPRGLFYVSMIFLISTVSIWYLRLQMKLYLSERHLALDARERRAFAETYLSLLKGADVSNEHEAVILASLFRPTQDGIIRDDAGPDAGLAGLLAKVLDGK